MPKVYHTDGMPISAVARGDSLSKPIDHVGALSAEIGTRGTATHGEEQGAHYAAQVLQNLGYQVEEQAFRTVPTFSWAYLILYLLPALALAVSFVSRQAAAVLAVLAALAFFLELNTVEVVNRLLPKRQSRNVLAHRPPLAASPKRKVVLVAHIDTSKAALNFSPQLVKGFRSSFLLMVLSMAAVAVLALLRFWLSTPILLWLQLPFVLYLLVTAGFLLHRENWNRYTEGANDNASGVGIVLSLAEQMRRQAPNLDLWCLITGAEEAGTFGMIRFLQAQGRDFRDAYFLNLDNVGAGTFHFMSGEGMFPTWKSSAPLLELCRQVRDEHPDLGVKQGVYNLMSTDALPALARGYRAISFLAVDEAGLLPNWHWLSDTYENVTECTLNQGQQFVAHVLERLDQQA